MKWNAQVCVIRGQYIDNLILSNYNKDLAIILKENTVGDKTGN